MIAIMKKRGLVSLITLTLSTASNFSAAEATDTLTASEIPAFTTGWNSLIEGASSGATSATVGWALSLLGVGSSGTSLSTINSDLQAIESELATIETELAAIVDALAVQDCEAASGNSDTTLAAAVSAITIAYTNSDSTGYADLIKLAAAGAISQDTYNLAIFGTKSVTTGYNWQNYPSSWLYLVLNTSGGDTDPGVGVAIGNINAQLLGSTGILAECIGPYTTAYLSNTDLSGTSTASGPYGHPFDDLGYYTGIQNMVGQYVSLQIQGAAMVAEAYHFLACVEAAADATIISVTSCDFSSNSNNTSPVYEICNTGNAALNNSTVASYCSLANSSVTNTYSTIEAELIYAGAPYSWPGTADNPRTIGIVYPMYSGGFTSSSVALIAPQSLEDFNNNAVNVTTGGADFDSCANISDTSPLTSESTGCGFTAGYYSDTYYLDKEGSKATSITYGGYTGPWSPPDDSDDGNYVWSTLMRTFNVSAALTCAGSTDNTACTYPTVGSTAPDYMTSIGFQNPANKIILLQKSNDNIGQLFDFEGSAVCNVFTNEEAGHIPFCTGLNDSGDVSAMQHDSDCSFDCSDYPADNIKDAISRADSAASDKTYAVGFYYFPTQTCTLIFCSGSDTINGWFLDPGISSGYTPIAAKFNQYRWPFLSAKDVTCSVRAKDGYLNPGGIFYTMCGDDLQEYVDSILPAPGTSVAQALNVGASGGYQTGQTLSVSLRLSNNDAGVTHDVFMGAIHPDGNTMTFVTGLDPLTLEQGFLNNPRSFKALIRNQVIEKGTQSTHPDVFRYTFSGTEATGNFQFFTALTNPGAFDNGSIDKGDIIAINSDFFDFMGSAQ